MTSASHVAARFSPLALSEDLSISRMFALSADFRFDGDGATPSADLQSLRKKIPSTLSWDSVQTELAGSVTEALHSSLLELLGEGWKRYRALLDDARRSRKAPTDVILSSLAEHSIESTLHPYVEVFLGRTRINKITFDVTLTTTLRGLLLGLQNGDIVSVEMGDCQWSGKIALGKVDLIERSLQPLSLPGRIRLKHSIPLLKH